MAFSSVLGVFVIVTLVFCVLVVVMAALRPSLFGSLIRGFTSKDAKSDDEMQAEIKSVNWKKGIFRLTLVLSILFGVFAGMAGVEVSNSSGVFLAGFFIFFGLTWVIYFALGFVIRGFTSKK